MGSFECYVVDYFAKNGEIPNFRAQYLEELDYEKLRKCIKEFWDCPNLNKDIEIVADEKLHELREALEKKIIKESIIETTSEVIARRLHLKQYEVYDWLKKYHISFNEIMDASIEDIVDSCIHDKQLKRG